MGCTSRLNVRGLCCCVEARLRPRKVRGSTCPQPTRRDKTGIEPSPGLQAGALAAAAAGRLPGRSPGQVLLSPGLAAQAAYPTGAHLSEDSLRVAARRTELRPPVECSGAGTAVPQRSSTALGRP
eukprot:354695-Chlamydomonas_euryale.AAC.1